MSLGNNFIINLFYIYLLIIFILTISSIYVFIAKKKNTILKITLPIILFVLIVAPTIWIFSLFTYERVSEESMIRTFLKNKEKFSIVAQYMVAYGENTHINDVKDSYEIDYFSDDLNSRGEEILDENVKKEIDFILKDLKYKSIFYSGGYVSFARTFDPAARSQRVIYVLDESDLRKQEGVEIEFIEDGWYYYWGR